MLFVVALARQQLCKQTLPSCHGRQAQWVARTFSVEGIVRKTLRVSDADDMSDDGGTHKTWLIPLALVPTCPCFM